MIHRSPSPKIVLTLLLLGLTASARAQWIETLELVPTRSVVAVPRTAYVVPTSVLVPTTVPARVYEFSPTVQYVETAYYSAPRGVFRPRRVYERTYVTTDRVVLRPTTYVAPTRYIVPTTYYVAPTTYVATSGLIASSSVLCCEVAGVPVAQPVAPRVMPKESRSTAIGTIESRVAGTGEEGPIVRDDGVESTGGTTPSSVEPPARTALPPVDKASPAASAPKKSIPSTVDVPKAEPKAPAPTKSEEPKPAATVAPKPEPKAAEAKPAPGPDPVKPGEKVSIPPPALPSESSPPSPPLPEPDVVPPLDVPAPLDLPKPGDSTKYEVKRPVVPALDPLAKPMRNVLQGRIVSADTRDPEEGVEVVLSDRTARFLDRTTKTDAFGRFAVSLPDGDWAIKVTMPSGRVLAVGQGVVTAASGKVLDMYGRDLTNLVIQR